MIGPTFDEFMQRPDSEWTKTDRILLQTIAMLSTTSYTHDTPDVIWDIARAQAAVVQGEERG
jgi:hypothetical protein